MGIPLPMGMNAPGKQRRESLGTPPVPGEESRYGFSVTALEFI